MVSPCDTPDYRLGIGVFLTALLFYAVFIPNTVYWLDAPEFAAAGFSLGMVHPPGHPVVLLLLRALDSLPIGSVAFRSNLFSAFFAALSAAMLALLSFDVSMTAGFTRQPSQLFAWVAGLGFAFSPALTTQGVGVEVYSLNSFFVFTALWLALRSRQLPGAAVLAAFFLGLGAANHHYLTILITPAVVWAAWPALKRQPRLLLPSAFAFIVPLGLYFYLVMRVQHSPMPPWTDLDGPVDLFNYVSARTFAGSVSGLSLVRIMKNVGTAVFMASAQMSPLFLVVSVLGMAVLFARRRDMLNLLLVFTALDLLSKVAMSILDPGNPDAYGYFLPAFGMLFMFAGIAGLPLLKTRLRSVGIAAGLGLVLVSGVFGLRPGLHRRNFHDTDTYARIALRTLPRDSVVMMSFYPTFFLSMYERIVAGLRPDCTFVQASFYDKSGGRHAYARHLCHHDKALCPIAMKFAATRTINWPMVISLAKHRPVMFEPEHGMTRLLTPFSFRGFFFQAPGGPATPKRFSAGTFVQLLNNAFGIPGAMDVETGRILLRLQYLDAETLSAQGRIRDAGVLVKSCVHLAPGDPMVRSLSRRLLGQASP